jgi:outer membrane lipoprotein-sorting protein
MHSVFVPPPLRTFAVTSRLKQKAPFAFAGLLVLLAGDTRAAPPSASDIVAAADTIRSPQGAYRVSVGLVEYVDGKARDQVELAVHAKLYPDTHRFKNLVRYAAPPRDVGKLVLLNGSNMWFYDPASKASIRISPQQRLMGQAANGDVVTVNLALDYTAKLLGEETIQDADRKERQVWHLELAAATDEAMYGRLEFWIEKDSYRPVKAKFYADSGRLLKIAYYRKYEPQLGAARATETIIIDAVDGRLVTKMTYSGFRAEAAKDTWFQRDYLPRFKEE